MGEGAALWTRVAQGWVAAARAGTARLRVAWGAAARVKARVRIRCGTCACAWRVVCRRDASMCKSEMAGVAVEVGEWGRGELRTCAASACGAGASS